jgi:hypothetical protein
MENQQGSAIANLPSKLSAEEKLKSAVRESELIFSGTVVNTGDPPKTFSDILTAYQPVEYRVEQILKGTHRGTQIAVAHLIIASAEESRLSPGLFFLGSRLIVFAVKGEDGAWKDLQQEKVVLPISDETLSMIHSML